MQLIQPKVQKSTNTTLPRSSARRKGCWVFSQTSVWISGAGPKSEAGAGGAVGVGVGVGDESVGIAAAVGVGNVVVGEGGGGKTGAGAVFVAVGTAAMATGSSLPSPAEGVALQAANTTPIPSQSIRPERCRFMSWLHRGGVPSTIALVSSAASKQTPTPSPA